MPKLGAREASSARVSAHGDTAARGGGPTPAGLMDRDAGKVPMREGGWAP